MTVYSEQIRRIKAKLLAAKAADPQLKAFGAESHQYQLNQSASIQEVEDFEEWYSVKLPSCYRSFILNIGNGGRSYSGSAAGPFYGIYPLGENIDELVTDNKGTYLKNDCILYPKMTNDFWTNLNKNIDDNDDIPDDEYEKEVGKIYGGILPIGSQGCTYLHGIVLNGKHRGRVVNLDMDRQMPKFAYESNFLDWYERWLDEVIAGELLVNTAGWFGYTMGGNERELIHNFLSSDEVDFKDDCLVGMLTKRKISEETLTIIETEYLNNNTELKTTLLQVLVKFHYERAKPYLVELMNTDLLAAFKFLYWYAKDRSSEWLDLIELHIGRITDEETFRFCTYLLTETQSDYGHLIVPFTAKESETIRVTAFYTLGKLKNKGDYLDVFVNGLNDNANRVIHSALQALSDVKDNRLLKHYKNIAERFPVEQDYILANLNHRLADYGLNNLTIKAIDVTNYGRKG